METKKNIFLVAYIFSVLAYLGIRLLDIPKVYAFSVQPLMLLSLTGYYLVSVDDKSKFYLLALLFTMIGSLFFLDKDSLENFIIGLILSFIANMFFLLVIVHRMGIIKLKDVIIRATPIYILLAILVCSFFAVLIGVKIIIFLYIISLALLLAFVFMYTKTSYVKLKSFLFAGVILMVVRDFFTGLSILLKLEDSFYIVIDILCHAIAMYLICQALIEEGRSLKQS